jgi:hypothetical protein
MFITHNTHIFHTWMTNFLNILNILHFSAKGKSKRNNEKTYVTIKYNAMKDRKWRRQKAQSSPSITKCELHTSLEHVA